jgi:hypothetical protein
MSKFLQGAMVSFTIALLCSCLLPSAFASSSTALGSTYRDDTPSDVWPGEVAAASALANQITNYASMAGYSAYDWYGTQTTASNIYTAAAGNGAPYANGVPLSISFYIGHGGIENLVFWNQYFIMDNNGGSVYDSDIYTHTLDHETSFALLWSCETGDEIGGTNWYLTGPLAYGMPYAWLHTTSLSSDGYDNPDTSNLCFIGWHKIAPGVSLDFTQTLDGVVTFNTNAQNGIAYFLSQFYFYAVGCRYSVNIALDEAAQQTWAIPNFGYSVLWCETKWEAVGGSGNMVVYGDGNIHLKPVSPLFAMKTRMDGRFYKPNTSFQFVKVEEWFTNSSAEGDQVEKSVAGYPFWFPDGIVNLADLVTVAHAYGTHEGDPHWNYQADIDADHYVGLSDLVYISKNYGQSGNWYSSDLRYVSIVFHFADNSNQTEYPDNNGFVAVPSNCTGWTVYNNYITPVGAFLTFWWG